MNKSDVTKSMLEDLVKKFNDNIVSKEEPLPTGKKKGEIKVLLEAELIGAANELLQPGDEKFFDAHDIELMSTIGIDFAALTGVGAEPISGSEASPSPAETDVGATEEVQTEEVVEEATEETEAEETKAPEAEEKPKKVKKEKKPKAEKNFWGHRVGSGTDIIDQVLIKMIEGKEDAQVSVKEIADKTGLSATRIRPHLYTILKKGIAKFTYKK